MPKQHLPATIDALDELMRNIPRNIAAAFAELREIIEGTIPEATCRANLGWRSLNFSHPVVGYFCGLFPFPDRVDVVFEFGVLLPDPDGLFHSLRTQIGVVRVESVRDIRRRPFKRMLKEAVLLPEDRATRLALVRVAAKRAR